MYMTKWRFMIVVGASLFDAGCDSAGPSKQENLGRGIVQGTLGARPDNATRLAAPAHASMLEGQVTAVEGGAYLVREINGVDRRLAHDENTRIDRPAHVGDRIEAFMDEGGRAVLIRNRDRDER